MKSVGIICEYNPLHLGHRKQMRLVRSLRGPDTAIVCLMSGSYDIQLIIEGKTLREVAQFVAMKLAPMECITSTATSFVLKKYKDKGVIYASHEEDERGICPV